LTVIWHHIDGVQASLANVLLKLLHTLS